MQQIDFTEGGYINPAFTDTLDAYSDTITGYALPARASPLVHDHPDLRRHQPDPAHGHGPPAPEGAQ